MLRITTKAHKCDLSSEKYQLLKEEEKKRATFDAPAMEAFIC